MSAAPGPPRVRRWPEILQDGSEMGRRMYEYPWHTTSLGALDTWPQSMRTAVTLMLGSRSASLVLAGPDLLQLYNDAAIHILAGHYPALTFAAPVCEGWSKWWPSLEPLSHACMLDGSSFTVEQMHSSMTCIPIFDESFAVSGLAATIVEHIAASIGKAPASLLSQSPLSLACTAYPINVVSGSDEGRARRDIFVAAKPFAGIDLLSRVRANKRAAPLRRDYDRQKRVSESFQAASLPASLPRIPNVSFDALYIPGSDGLKVGGDWYDAVRLRDGRIVVSIGDVAGSGLDAAVTMGNVRQVIRGIAQVHADPALILNAADRALRLDHEDVYVTAFVGVIDLVAKTMTFASAGHPPALLRRSDGVVTSLTTGGLPLGLRGESREQSASIELTDDSMLVLYTDGVTEAARDPLAGEYSLRATVAGLTAGPSLAAQIYEHLLDDRYSADDVAILVVHVHSLTVDTPGDENYTSWSFSSDDGKAAQGARHAFSRALTSRGLHGIDVANAEVVFGELLSNVTRYAPGIADVTVDWSGAAPVLHVMERGPGFEHIAALPTDVFSESGRGLFLISNLADGFQVTRRPGGGSHARVIVRVTPKPPQRGAVRDTLCLA